ADEAEGEGPVVRGAGERLYRRLVALPDVRRPLRDQPGLYDHPVRRPAWQCRSRRGDRLAAHRRDDDDEDGEARNMSALFDMFSGDDLMVFFASATAVMVLLVIWDALVIRDPVTARLRNFARIREDMKSGLAVGSRQNR